MRESFLLFAGKFRREQVDTNLLKRQINMYRKYFYEGPDPLKINNLQYWRQSHDTEEISEL